LLPRLNWIAVESGALRRVLGGNVGIGYKKSDYGGERGLDSERHPAQKAQPFVLCARHVFPHGRSQADSSVNGFLPKFSG